MMSEKIRLTQTQVDFVVEITEIQEPVRAVEKFAEIMIEERFSVNRMGELIDRILKRMDK